jgi:PAS domain S-box-containing protein
MNKAPQNLIAQLIALWTRLIAPAAWVEDSDLRQQSKLLAAFMAIVFFILVASLLPFTPADAYDQIARLVSIAGVLGLFALCKQGKPRLAVQLAVVAATSGVLLIAYTAVPADATSALYYLMVILVFASLFLPLRHTIVLFIAHLFGSLLYPIFAGDLSLFHVARSSLQYVTLIGSLVILIAYYRQRLEASRLRQLSASEARYKLISNLMSDYAFCTRVNPDGTWEREWITDSFKRFTGYDDSTSFVMKADLFHPDDRARIVTDIHRVQQGETQAGDYRIVKANGEVRWVQIERIPEKNPASGRVERYYGVVHDITERKQAEEARLKAALEHERMALVSRFIEGVSHDFRTTISQIETSRYLIERLLPAETTNHSKIQEKMEHIRAAITHMSNQLENFDTIGSLTAMSFKPLAINGFLDEIVKAFHYRAGQKQITLYFSPAESLPLIDADRKELAHAVRHLISNAVNHTATGGKISVCTMLLEGEVALEVTDSGVGIPSDQIKYIFDFFYRVDSARSVEIGGVGLGLSIVRMIVEAHRGSIDVRSQVGSGTTFTLKFPAMAAEVLQRVSA